MAAVFRVAFCNDVLFAEVLHPHCKQYPEDMDLFWLRRSQRDWFNPRHHFIVGTVPDTERPGKDLVVGVAHWERVGPGGPKSWNPVLPLMRGLMKVWVTISSWVRPNRAADPSKANLLEKSFPFIQHLWTGSRAECWDLHFLAVHPSYGGLGIGRKLVKWGLDQSEKEGVDACVIMAPGKEKFYELCGYHPEVVGRAGMGEGNPLADVAGGNIFFKNPTK